MLIALRHVPLTYMYLLSICCRNVSAESCCNVLMTGIISPDWKQLHPGTAGVYVWAAFGEARNKRLGCCGCDDEDGQTCTIDHAMTVQHARSALETERDKTAPSLQALAAAVTPTECWSISLLRGITSVVVADRLSCTPLLSTVEPI